MADTPSIVKKVKKKQKAFRLPIELIKKFDDITNELNIDQSETVANLISELVEKLENAKKTA